MPVYKKPLYISASQYIKGGNSPELIPSEITSLGKDLISGLEDEISRAHASTLLINSQLNELEARGLRSNPKNLEKYLHSISTFVRAGRASNRLFQARDKIKSMQEADISIRLELLDLCREGPDDRPGALTGGLIRTSQKLTIFYSKLFRKNMDLTDRQWKLIEQLFPSRVMDGAGRPPQSCRDVLNGIFWKLRTGASWDDLPLEYPSHQTCYRYFNRWIKDGTLERTLRLLKTDLESNGLDLSLAIQRSEIELIPFSRRIVISFAPHLQDTWQGSTALLLLQVLLTKTGKGGRSAKKPTHVFTPIMDAIRIMNDDPDRT